jgi:hypothetical protein
MVAEIHLVGILRSMRCVSGRGEMRAGVTCVPGVIVDGLLVVM